MSIKRSELHEMLPLEQPLSLHIFPSFYCNFRCDYCLHSLSKVKLDEMKFKKQNMDFITFKKAIDDLILFEKKLKALIFAGHGEPLVHPQIADMVAYAKEKNIAERIEIVTNASLLTKEMSDKLIIAGVDRLKISIQGLTSEKYSSVAGVNIEFENIINNIKYFYQNKKHTEMYVKIIDIALDKGDADKFEEIFSPIADNIAIEYAIPFVNEIDYEQIGRVGNRCKQGHIQRSNICSMPFYMLVLYPNGDLIPCCSVDIPINFGNIHDKSLYEIWHSEIRKEFLKKQLLGYKNINVCRECSVPEFGLQQGDYLDQYKEKLIQLY